MAKVLTAGQIVTAMRRADPANAIKLTNPDEYKKVSYQEFFSAIEIISDLTDTEKQGLIKLQDEMTYLISNSDKFHFHEDKIYIYFILRLQEVMGLWH